MPISYFQIKNNKLILIFIVILLAIGVFFAVKLLFFSADKIPSDLGVKPPDIINAENIRINKINSEMLASQKFKDFKEYPAKIMKIEDIEKGNDSPFEAKIKNEKTALDNTLIEKLFIEFTASFGVELTAEEKAKCLEDIDKQKLSSDKYRGQINTCFTDKRNKLLM